jgi:hypothetical protein
MTGTLFMNAGCCTRIYCNGNTNMWICNEVSLIHCFITDALLIVPIKNTPNLLVLPVDIAAAAQVIVDHCTNTGGSPFDFFTTGGQVFDGDGFNVIISWGSCNDISGGNDWTKRDESKQIARRDPGEFARHDLVSKR